MESKCPNCGEKAVPMGKFVMLPVQLNTGVKFLWWVLPKWLACKVVSAISLYCPKCGFLAVQEIKL